MTNTMEFGINKNGSKYEAVFYAPRAKEAAVKLFRPGEDKPCESIRMNRDSSGKGLFSCEFSTDSEEYLFEADGKYYLDPAARQLAGDGKFGANINIAADKQSHTKKAHPETDKNPGNPAAVRCRLNVERPVAAHDRESFKPVDFSDMFIYKLHARGFTMHPSSGVRNKGTFAGVAEKVGYLKELGVNAVLLMPCYDFDEHMDRGFGRVEKLNFWGYGAGSRYFAPKSSYAAQPDRVCEEFAKMVGDLHRAGLAVLMEMDFTHETPDIIMLEALRYWKDVYGIDGFRLIGEYAPKRLFASDPCLEGTLLIAGSWDDDCIRTYEGTTGHLAECNDTFMIGVRRFIKGDEGQVRDFSDLLRRNCSRTAKINYLADHDGFTLNDVYSYDERHNEANGEMNMDGREINYSWNCGVEGETGRRNVLKLRIRMIKNALATLFLSQGTPMLMAGDEFGNTHKGNNNPYCCDNELSWVVWEKTSRSRELLEFTTKLAALRKEHRVFSNKIELVGTDYIYKGCPDVSFHGTRAWFPDYGYYSRTLGMLLNGEYAVVDRNKRDNSFYIAFNMHWEEHEFDLPGNGKSEFGLVMTTDADNKLTENRTCIIKPRSIAVFEIKDVKAKGNKR